MSQQSQMFELLDVCINSAMSMLYIYWFTLKFHIICFLILCLSQAGFRPWSSFAEAEKETKLKVAKTEQFGILDEPGHGS